jgi:hypothetical protein
MTNHTPADILRHAADVRAAKERAYGDSYLHGGKLLRALFPRGFRMETEADLNRLYLFVHLLTKVDRYAKAMERGEACDDSITDAMVYAALMAHADEVLSKEPPSISSLVNLARSPDHVSGSRDPAESRPDARREERRRGDGLLEGDRRYEKGHVEGHPSTEERAG